MRGRTFGLIVARLLPHRLKEVLGFVELVQHFAAGRTDDLLRHVGKVVYVAPDNNQARIRTESRGSGALSGGNEEDSQK